MTKVRENRYVPLKNWYFLSMPFIFSIVFLVFAYGHLTWFTVFFELIITVALVKNKLNEDVKINIIAKELKIEDRYKSICMYYLIISCVELIICLIVYIANLDDTMWFVPIFYFAWATIVYSNSHWLREGELKAILDEGYEGRHGQLMLANDINILVEKARIASINLNKEERDIIENTMGLLLASLQKEDSLDSNLSILEYANSYVSMVECLSNEVDNLENLKSVEKEIESTCSSIRKKAESLRKDKLKSLVSRELVSIGRY